VSGLLGSIVFRIPLDRDVLIRMRKQVKSIFDPTSLVVIIR